MSEQRTMSEQRRVSRLAALAWAGGVLGSFGCADAGPASSIGGPARSGSGRAEQSIIGGLVATNPLLDHTGTLTFVVRESGARDALCSASLIGPQTVVTASHCISQMAMFEQFGIDVFWSPGPDFNSPLENIPVVAVEGAPGDEVGFTGFGRDVGVAHLDEPSEGIPTIGIQPFRRDLLGASMVTLGYGVSSAVGLVDGLRHIGRETVTQLQGRALEGLFGDFETFVELVVRGEATSEDVLAAVEADPSLADLGALRAEYDGTLLIEDYEVVTGRAPGDTQSCELDSGGPLAQVTPDGNWESFGVVSGGPRLTRPICIFGQVFAVFGPDTFEFLDAARGWEDPCGNVGVAGECAGNLLRRCDSSFAASVRQLVEQDCAAAGGECLATEAGASCSVPGPTAPVAAGDAG